MQYAFEVLSGGTGTVSAAKAFKKVIEGDKIDRFGARFGLVFASIDCGDLSAARKEIEYIKANMNENEIPSEIYWALVIIEYISFAVLQEEGSDGDAAENALKEALNKNEYIPMIFRNHKKLEKAVDPDEVEQAIRLERDKKLNLAFRKEQLPGDKFIGTLSAGTLESGSFDEAIVLFLNQISCWKDAKGSLEWLESTSNLFLKSKNSISKKVPDNDRLILKSIVLDKDSPLYFLSKKCHKALLE